MKKKGEDEEAQTDEEGTNPDHELLPEDKTGATDLSDLGEVSDETVDEAEDEPENVRKAKAGGKESPADALKKKKSLIIKVVIGVALVALILHEPAEDEQPVESKAPIQKPKKTTPTPADVAATPATPSPAETPATPETVETPEKPATPEKSATPETAETQAPVATETPSVPVETPVVTENAPAETETPPAQEPAIETPAKEDTPIATDTPDETKIPAPEEITLDLNPVETPSDTGPTTTSETSVDSIDGNVVDSSGEDNLTDKILQDLEKEAKKSEVKIDKKEYVAPPDYEYTGRGLVYNCVGKHWACVDGPSYKSCEENASSTKFLKKTAECYPFNVYQSQKGCERMQNRMVSSSAKTSFCSE